MIEGSGDGYAFICYQNRGYEDRFMIAHTDRIKYYAVFDGHGESGISTPSLISDGHGDPRLSAPSLISDGHREKGKLSSEHVVLYVKENLHNYILHVIDKVTLTDAEICDRIKSVFIKLDEHMKKCGGKFGCTAGIILVLPDRVFQINLGDSRSIVYTDNMYSETEDHTIENDKVEGIEIEDGRVGGLLAITRAFGDYCLKPGVSCIPDIIVTKRTIGMKFILATDGLYSGFFDSSRNVLDIVHELTSHRQIVRVLCKQAMLNNYDDDTTIISGDI